MRIQVDNLESNDITELLTFHHESMLSLSPPESAHALDLEEMKDPSITLWSVWIDNELAGCGALKELDARHAEIKSMRTSPKFLRRGVASKMLAFIIDEAKARNYNLLSLETGTPEPFLPAQKLYLSQGFEYCPPFANYEEDPYSVYMNKVL
ncbi:GNAT family N-acetyltransferase [Marinomonas mediterranea]|jgi:Acetyltransferase (GNAT) family.|uniref:GCN5-related N-acetyltransferase n=1 Tax=Marinomonas mediterranea (strain ATCC 700492 / JCM 21426 / NBRC 103028 / MMB-1) TaxID=717774 RepID=F2JZF7_MARM1|nr:GNAT family N-acetyltransferase [Marinomonas mediterranea]ADZ89740.1 GCN5-related N-acetyltransferase [Marinomonas mediterranea MMB-1]WCN07833.1 GNAT family N-acetyltransferase [Marinomonas mediterranea]WCN11927.1 GNAT family N-acetyltransferase [Marinomonas mediterranea]WCN15965.1 GNAT family N-acetyltransferase [Marinomonas mediterranea MMB-1]